MEETEERTAQIEEAEERIALIEEALDRTPEGIIPPIHTSERVGMLSWQNPLKTPSSAVSTRHMKADSITAGKIVAGAITADKIAAGAITATAFNLALILIGGATWTDNSPSGGSVSWSGATAYYQGTSYPITNSNTALKYIWWSSTTSNTTFQSSNTRPTLTDAEFLIATNNGGTHDLTWNAVGNLVVNPGHLNFDAMASLFIYGDGIDGNVTITGNTTLTRDMSYDNLTISNSATLFPDGYRIFVKNTLTIGSACAIASDGTTGGNGALNTAGTGGAALTNNHMGGSAAGGNGGTTGGGVAGSNLTNGVGMGGAGGGTGDRGGGCSANTGGAGGTVVASYANRHGLVILGTFAEIRGGAGGGGGGGGVSDCLAGSPDCSSGNNGGGGGGGAGGGVIIIAAKTILHNGGGGANIRARGGGGGIGHAANAGGNNSNGGGGGGGGGGAVILVYRTATITEDILIGGGAGGAGGTAAVALSCRTTVAAANGTAGTAGLTLLVNQEA